MTMNYDENKRVMIELFASQLQQWLTDMLKGELTEVELDLLLEDAILQEIIEEQYQWYELVFVIFFKFTSNFSIYFRSFLVRMVEQYERSLNDIDLSGDPKSLLVMCPICQISELHITNHLLHCKCGFQ